MSWANRRDRNTRREQTRAESAARLKATELRRHARCPLCGKDCAGDEVKVVGLTRRLNGAEARHWHLVMAHGWVPQGGWVAAALRWRRAA